MGRKITSGLVALWGVKSELDHEMESEEWPVSGMSTAMAEGRKEGGRGGGGREDPALILDLGVDRSKCNSLT